MAASDPSYPIEESSEWLNTYITDEISNMREFDPCVALCDSYEQFMQRSCQKQTLTVLMLDAVHEKASKLNDVQAIFLQSVNVLDYLQQIAVKLGDQWVDGKFFDEWLPIFIRHIH